MARRTEEREQFLADIVIGAVEGATGYWARILSYRHSKGAAMTRAVLIEEDDDETRERIAAAAREKGAKLTVAEALDIEGVRLLDIDAVARGIGRITRGEVAIREDLRTLIAEASRANDAGYIDADAADVIAQVALLGEITYG